MCWWTTYSNLVTIQRWTKEIELQQPQNYKACISQFVNWNDDPFGQDVEHVLTDNILKTGDDPTVNQRDQRQYRWERERERERGERECLISNSVCCLYLVVQYDDTTKYKFIGRSLMTRYPNTLRPNWTSKTGRKSNLLRSKIETPTKRSRNGLKFSI